jgi:hypothetical protein
MDGGRKQTLISSQVAQEPQKLLVHGDTNKCNIVNGPVAVNGKIHFKGNNSKSPASQPRVVQNVGTDATAAVTVGGSMNYTLVCESLNVEGLTFGGDDDGGS